MNNNLAYIYFLPENLTIDEETAEKEEQHKNLL